MSDEIKHAGSKGYLLMGGFIALLLFVILVVYLYKANQNFVPQDPELYGALTTVFGQGWA